MCMGVNILCGLRNGRIMAFIRVSENAPITRARHSSKMADIRSLTYDTDIFCITISIFMRAYAKLHLEQ